MNRDGRPDILLGEDDGLFVYFNQGGGRLLPGPVHPITTNDFNVADFNGDGHVDIVYGSLGFLLGDGLGGFVPLPFQFRTNAFPPLSIGDVDGDGRPDVVARSGSTLSLMYNQSR